MRIGDGMNPMTKRIDRMPRPRRRAVVAIGLAGYPLAVALLIALKDAGLNRFVTLAVFLAAALVSAAAVLVGYGYARGRIDGRGRLDERDLSLRQQAYAASHRVLAVILIVVAAVTEVYVTSGHALRLDSGTILPALMWVIVYIPALPALMLSWIEKDLPADA